MSFLAPLIGPALGILGASKASSAQNKATKQANEAAQQAVVDPTEVQRVARETAAENIRNSLALEQQYTPENAALRQQSIRQLLSGIGNDGTSNEAIASVRNQLNGVQPNSQLLTDAIQMAGQDLAQGGKLPQDVRNEVARASLANAGAVGGGRLGLAQFLTPRDLGISSLALRNDRLNRASQLGQQDFGNQLNASSLRSQLASLIANLGTNQYNQNLSTASFGQSLQPPQAGLSPGDIASLYTQNATNRAQAGMNAAQLQAQTGRNTGEALSGLGGLVQGVDWGAIFNRGTPAPTSTPNFNVQPPPTIRLPSFNLGG